MTEHKNSATAAHARNIITTWKNPAEEAAYLSCHPKRQPTSPAQNMVAYRKKKKQEEEAEKEDEKKTKEEAEEDRK